MSDIFKEKLYFSSDGFLEVFDEGSRGMLTLRGKFNNEFKKAVTNSTGVNFPDRCKIEIKKERSLAWMSVDELLFSFAEEEISDMKNKISDAFKNFNALIADVSAARVVFCLSGTRVREVIAKLAPVDIAPDRFNINEFRRTRFGQISAAFWFVSGEKVRVMCSRSYSEYMFSLLCRASENGSEVGLWD